MQIYTILVSYFAFLITTTIKLNYNNLLLITFYNNKYNVSIIIKQIKIKTLFTTIIIIIIQSRKRVITTIKTIKIKTSQAINITIQITILILILKIIINLLLLKQISFFFKCLANILEKLFVNVAINNFYYNTNYINIFVFAKLNNLLRKYTITKLLYL